MGPKAGSWSRASQTMRAPVRSKPGACTLSVTGTLRTATAVGAVMVAEPERHTCDCVVVCVASALTARRLRA